MDRIIHFFADTQAAGPIDILINMVLAAVFSWLVYGVYVRYGSSLSNRRQFGHTFLLITVCTALIISLIKSSIALSLGLVGALSIVRFRTAVKEPEELTYLFFCIAIGLGFGANERLITAAASLLILVVLVLRGLFAHKTLDRDYNMSIVSSSLGLNEMTELLSPYCTELVLKRLEQRAESTDVLLKVGFKASSSLQEALQALRHQDKQVRITFLES